MSVKFHTSRHWVEVGQLEVGQGKKMNGFGMLIDKILATRPTWPTYFLFTYIGGSPLSFPPVTSRGWTGWTGWTPGSRAGLFHVTVLDMAKDAESEKARDLARIEAALDKIESVMMAKAPGQSHPTFVQALETAQLKAIDRIVPLLERKASMLGYDAPRPGKDDDRNQTGTLAELERKLALVGPGKAS